MAGGFFPKPEKAGNPAFFASSFSAKRRAAPRPGRRAGPFGKEINKR